MMISKTIKLTALSIAAAVVMAACSDTKSKDHSDSEVVDVKVKKTILPDGVGYFSTSGQIEADQFANISTRMMGYVSSVHVKVGEKVRKGQALIDINNSDLEAKRAQARAGIIQAEARYGIAEKDLNRYTVLYDQKSASQKEFDDVKTQYSVAKAQLESARQAEKEVEAMLFYTNIKAPFNGIVTSKSVEVGDMANPGQPLLSIEHPGKFVAIAMIPETNIGNVHQNDSVKVLVKSNEKTLMGSVSEISTSSQNSGGQYIVKIKLNIPEGTQLFSGMFISAVFPSADKQVSRVMVPNNAIIHRGDLQGIYTVSSSNTAILRWLKLGRSIGTDVEVLSGLSADEQYIVEADGKLYNGAKINIKQ